MESALWNVTWQGEVTFERLQKYGVEPMERLISLIKNQLGSSWLMDLMAKNSEAFEDISFLVERLELKVFSLGMAIAGLKDKFNGHVDFYDVCFFSYNLPLVPGQMADYLCDMFYMPAKSLAEILNDKLSDLQDFTYKNRFEIEGAEFTNTDLIKTRGLIRELLNLINDLFRVFDNIDNQIEHSEACPKLAK